MIDRNYYKEKIQPMIDEYNEELIKELDKTLKANDNKSIIKLANIVFFTNTISIEKKIDSFISILENRCHVSNYQKSYYKDELQKLINSFTFLSESPDYIFDREYLKNIVQKLKDIRMKHNINIDIRSLESRFGKISLFED